MPQMNVSISDESNETLAKHKRLAAIVKEETDEVLRQWLEETGAHLQVKYLTGGNWRQPRKGNGPLATRTGDLYRSIRTELDQPLSGTIGSAGNKYARVLLDGKSWTMVPKQANHLWMPLPDNMTGSGVMRMSPREAMSVRTSTGKRALQIFKSKKGNLVAFMPGDVVEDKAGKQLGLVRGSGLTAQSAGKHKRGQYKGRQKGQLLFVLKKSVTVQGTDAIAKAANDKQPRLLELLGAMVNRINQQRGQK